MKWTGLANYQLLFEEPELWNAFGRSVVFTVGAVGLQLAWGLVSALLLNRAFRGLDLVRSLFVLPYLLPSIVVALVFQWLLSQEYGVFTQVLMQTGAADQFLRRARDGHVGGHRHGGLAVRLLRHAPDPGAAAGHRSQALRGGRRLGRRHAARLLGRDPAQPAHHADRDRAPARHLDV